VSKAHPRLYTRGHPEIPDGTRVEVLHERLRFPLAFVRMPNGGTRYVSKDCLFEEEPPRLPCSAEGHRRMIATGWIDSLGVFHACSSARHREFAVLLGGMGPDPEGDLTNHGAIKVMSVPPAPGSCATPSIIALSGERGPTKAALEGLYAHACALQASGRSFEFECLHRSWKELHGG